jgi:hypothetical protein
MRYEDLTLVPIVQDGAPGHLYRDGKSNDWRFMPMIGGGATAQPAAIPALPFTASAHEHVEPAFTLTSALGAATVSFNPTDIPAYGYLRNIFLEFTVSGATGGTLATDGPWNIVQSVSLQDVNGANIAGPFDGYALYLANLFGAYANRSNPVDSPWFVGTAPNPTFFMRIPAEISRSDGLGALANQNASANYKCSITLNTSTNVYSVAPTGTATVVIKGFLEAWTLPAPADNRGRPQAQVPPLLGTGQYWSARTQSVLAGANTIGFTRVGNYIRQVILVGRDGTGARNNASLPDPFQFNWDGMSILNADQKYMQQSIYEQTNGTLTLPTGVLVLSYNKGGAAGDLGNDPSTLWLPTTQSSRLELTGTWAGSGSVQVVTNEVAPVDVDQATRYQFPNGSGAYAANVPASTSAS